jgi:hypothetical protein
MRSFSLSPSRRVALLLGAGALLRALPAHADPTTAECLIAHDEATELRAKHELRAARTKLQTCVAESCPAGLRTACLAELAQVSAAVPTLILDAVDAAGNDVSRVRVTMDGESLTDRIDGTAVAVEPGSHRFAFEVAGRPREERTLVLQEGEKDKRIRIEIAPPPPPPSHEGDTLRILGLALGGTALVSAGIATGFGLSARSNLAKSRVDCADSSSAATCANEPLAASEQQTANAQATVSTAAFIGAGALLAAGAFIFFSAPRGHASPVALSIAPGVGPSAASISLRGSF